MRALRGRLSGLCQPTYVLDIPGGYGKAVVAPDAYDGVEVEDFRRAAGTSILRINRLDQNRHFLIYPLLLYWRSGPSPAQDVGRRKDLPVE